MMHERLSITYHQTALYDLHCPLEVLVDLSLYSAFPSKMFIRIIWADSFLVGGVFDDETAVDASRGPDIHIIQSCQEEADTRIILHAKAAHREEYERLIIPAEILTF